MARRNPPQPGPTQPSGPTGTEGLTSSAELYVIKVPADGPYPGIHGGEQAPTAAPPANRIITMLRRAGISAGLRFVVPDTEASQMLTSVHCITVTLIWAITVIGTVVTTTSAGVAAVITLGIIALELAGFAITLLMTRRPRRRDNNLGGA